MVSTIQGIPVADQDLGLYSGPIADMTVEIESPLLDWKGARMSLRQWKIIVAFMRWTYAEFKSEAQLRLYYNERTNKWKPVVMPQEVGTGLSSKELPNHAGREAVFATVKEEDGWRPAGTVHHHCSIGAFQSGTDHKDEIDQPGLHLTLGKLLDDTIELHGRASFRKIMYSVNLMDWIQAVTVPLDVEIETRIPQCWKDNCILKPPYVAPSNKSLVGGRYPYNVSAEQTGAIPDYSWMNASDDDDVYEYNAGFAAGTHEYYAELEETDELDIQRFAAVMHPSLVGRFDLADMSSIMEVVCEITRLWENAKETFDLADVDYNYLASLFETQQREDIQDVLDEAPYASFGAEKGYI